MPAPLLSVIIPVGPAEREIPAGLLADLRQLPMGCEVLWVGCDRAKQTPLLQSLPAQHQYLFTQPGRAQQMNAGAAAAQGKFLWFLHLDSRFSTQLLNQLLQNLQQFPERLHYQRLAFLDDSGAPMRLNAVGANLRSELLGVPFGDQGFALSRELFNALGGYPEHAPYGEDHLFVWRVRQQGVKLHCNPHPLMTSARRYQQQGWLSLTLIYQYRWLRQALPQLFKLIKQRYFSPRCQR